MPGIVHNKVMTKQTLSLLTQLWTGGESTINKEANKLLRIKYYGEINKELS